MPPFEVSIKPGLPQPDPEETLIRPARNSAVPGAKGDSPAAIRSAFTNTGQLASFGKNSVANVVFPAPFGPAMTTIFFSRVTPLSPIPSKAQALLSFLSEILRDLFKLLQRRFQVLDDFLRA